MKSNYFERGHKTCFNCLCVSDVVILGTNWPNYNVVAAAAFFFGWLVGWGTNIKDVSTVVVVFQVLFSRSQPTHKYSHWWSLALFVFQFVQQYGGSGSGDHQEDAQDYQRSEGGKNEESYSTEPWLLHDLTSPIFMRYFDHTSTWTEAEAICRKHFGHLVRGKLNLFLLWGLSKGLFKSNLMVSNTGRQAANFFLPWVMNKRATCLELVYQLLGKLCIFKEGRTTYLTYYFQMAMATRQPSTIFYPAWMFILKSGLVCIRPHH